MEILESKSENETSEIRVEADESDTFVFEFLDDKTQGDKKVTQLLAKWGLEANLHIFNFRFNLKFSEINADKFLLDLFNSQQVKSILNAVNVPSKQCSKIDYKKLKCTLINLELFNKLEDAEIVVPTNKYIKKRLEEEIKGINVADKLRECFVDEDSEGYCVFNEEERRELLFRVLQHLVLGGSMCQYDDYITEYLEVTKLFYKTLASARKDPKTNQVFIESYAYEIRKIDGEKLFKDDDNPQNFLYVVVSPSLRQVNIFTHKWVPFW